MAMKQPVRRHRRCLVLVVLFVCMSLYSDSNNVSGLIVKIPTTATREFVSSSMRNPIPLSFSSSSAAASTTHNHPQPTTTTKRTLYDVPVSNNGARCRIIVYKKQLEDVIRIAPPSEIGGLTSPAYLKLNPQGKMPILVTTDENTAKEDAARHSSAITTTAIVESDTVARFLLSEYAHWKPQHSFLVDHPRSNMITRIHDMFLTTIQGCLYKPSTTAFGRFGHSRRDAIAEFQKQLLIINDLVVDGPNPESDDDDKTGVCRYLCGTEVSLADATLFPTAVFAWHMLPKFGIADALPPRLLDWFHSVRQHDADFARVHQEIMGGLEVWEKNQRWDPILASYIGWNDDDNTEPATLFDKILSGEIPAAVVEQPDDTVLCFRDINPAAPAHVLIVPKDHCGLTRLGRATAEHTEILGRLLVAAATISRNKDLGFGDGARIVINDGPDGGQEVMHLHVHVLGGRQLTWPPG